VPQDVFLFSDSVNNNIRFGLKNGKEGEVLQRQPGRPVLTGEIESFLSKI
jgi:hypothetical protein